MTSKSKQKNKNRETKTLGEVCEFRRGLTYKKTDEVNISNNSVLRANNIDLKTSKLNFDDVRYIDEKIEIPENKKLVKNSILICTASGSKSHLGKVAFIDENYDHAFGGFMGLLIPDQKIINPEYFFSILTSAFFREHISALTDGANINNLKFSQIEDFGISIPSPSEQKRIVKILDEKFAVIDELIKITKQQIVDAKELFESQLEQIFGPLVDSGEMIRMSDLYDVRDGTHDSPKYQNEGYALVTSKNLKEGNLSLDNVKFISKEDYFDICKRSKVSVGDVLFAMIGTIGNPVVVSDEPNYAIKNVALFKVPAQQSSDYLRYYLISKYARNKMSKEAKGATQKFVGLGYLRSFPIPELDYGQQKEVVKELDELSEKTKELEAIFRRKIADLEELKKSYLQDAFAGKL